MRQTLYIKPENAEFRIEGDNLMISCRQLVDCSIERIFLDFKGDLFYSVMGLKAVIE